MILKAKLKLKPGELGSLVTLQITCNRAVPATINSTRVYPAMSLSWLLPTPSSRLNSYLQQLNRQPFAAVSPAQNLTFSSNVLLCDVVLSRSLSSQSPCSLLVRGWVFVPKAFLPTSLLPPQPRFTRGRQHPVSCWDWRRSLVTSDA